MDSAIENEIELERGNEVMDIVNDKFYIFNLDEEIMRKVLIPVK